MTRNPGPSSQTRTNVEILTSENFGDFAVSADGVADISASLVALGFEVSVDQYRTAGAVSDVPAIIAARDAAGVNGVLQFGWDQYTYDAVVAPLAGQIWSFNKAKLKKRAPFIATLTAVANSGSATPTWTLSTLIDSAGNLLRVGQQLNVYKAGSVWSTAAAGATPDTQYSHTEQNNYTITAINTTTKQVFLSGNTQANSYAIGAFVVDSCSLFYAPTVAGVEFENLEIDGGLADRLANPDPDGHVYGQWIANTEFFLAGDRTRYENIYLHDTIGEGIILGGRGTVAENISGINTGGNLFHLTGEGGSTFLDGGSFVKKVYAKANSVGISRSHQNGVVTISTPVPDFSLSDFKVDGTAADNTTSVTPSFIGGISNTTRNLKIKDIKCYNTGLGTSAARTKPVVDFTAAWGTGAENCDGLEIKNFYGSDCGDFNINKSDTSTTAGRFTNADIDHIRISKGKITLNGIGAGSKINDLHVDNSYLITGQTRPAYDFKIIDGGAQISNFTSDSGAADGVGYIGDFSGNSSGARFTGKNIHKGGKSGFSFTGTGGLSVVEGLEHITDVVGGAQIRVNGAGWTLVNPKTTNTNTGGGSTGSSSGIDIAAQCLVINPLARFHSAAYTSAILVRAASTGTEIYNAISTAATPVSDSGTSTKNVNPQQTLIVS